MPRRRCLAKELAQKRFHGPAPGLPFFVHESRIPFLDRPWVATKMSQDEVSDTTDRAAVIFATVARNQSTKGRCVVDEPMLPSVSELFKYIVQGDQRCEQLALANKSFFGNPGADISV